MIYGVLGDPMYTPSATHPSWEPHGGRILARRHVINGVARLSLAHPDGGLQEGFNSPRGYIANRNPPVLLRWMEKTLRHYGYIRAPWAHLLAFVLYVVFICSI